MGNKFSGFYKNDQRNGWGVMEWIDGSIYKGQWQHGIQQGFGIMIYYQGADRHGSAGSKETKRPHKVRAGFFANNIFRQPLVNMQQVEQIQGLEGQLDDDVKQEIEEYLQNRHNKVKILAAKRGADPRSL